MKFKRGIKSPDRSKAVAIVAAAGRGKRFSRKTSKLFFNIGTKPVLFYSLQAFSGHPEISRIIVVCHRQKKDEVKKLIGKWSFGKVSDVIEGGPRRSDSVRNALDLLDADSFRIVLVHDAARPFLLKEQISLLIKAATAQKAAVLALPCVDTIKQTQTDKNGLFVVNTLEREKLWQAQTPQAFRTDIIKKAYQEKRLKATDDAGLVEKLGVRVRLVKGNSFNRKITTKEDLLWAKSFLKEFQSKKCVSV